jgi:hypothetical protein
VFNPASGDLLFWKIRSVLPTFRTKFSSRPWFYPKCWYLCTNPQGVTFQEAYPLISHFMYEPLRHKTRGSGLDFRWSPSKFCNDPVLLSAFREPGVHSASNRSECQEIFLGGKVRPVRKADNCAILVVPHVKYGWKSNILSPLSVYTTCYVKALSLPFIYRQF